MKSSPSNLINKIIKQDFFVTLLKSGGVKVASMAVVFLTSVFLSRVLGPEGYGIYTYAFSLAMLIGLPLHGGLSTLVMRSVAQYQKQKKWSCIKGLKKKANQLIVLASLIIGVILIVNFSYLEDPVLRLTHTFSIFLIPIVSLATIRASFLRGFDQPVAAQFPEDIVRPYSCIILLVFFYYFSEVTPQLAMALNIVTGLLALLLGHFLLARRTPIAVTSAQPSYEVRKWMKDMMPFTVIAGVQMLNSQLDVLMIGALLGKEVVGVYQVAAQVVVLVSFPLVIVNYVVAPKFAVHFLSGEIKLIQDIVRRSTKLIVIVSVPTALFFIVFGGHLD